MRGPEQPGGRRARRRGPRGAAWDPPDRRLVRHARAVPPEGPGERRAPRPRPPGAGVDPGAAGVPSGAVAPVPVHRQARRRGRFVRDRRRLRGRRSGRARGRRGAGMPAVGPHARPALRQRPGVQPGHRRRAGAPPRRDRFQPSRSGAARGGDVRGEVGARQSGRPGDDTEVPRAPAGPSRRTADPARRAGLGRRGRHRIRPHRRQGRRPGYDVRHGREPEPGSRGPGGIGAPGGRRRVELSRPDRPDRRGRPHRRRASGPGPTPPAALADARRLAEGMPYTQRLASALGRREPRGTRPT